MLATVQKQSDGYMAKFTRPLPHPVEAVWEVLTVNSKLQKWMSNLEIVDLRKSGKIHFNMNDGTEVFEEIVITDFVEKEVLEFDWGIDTVRFELSPTAEGSLLALQESISEITNHTPKDLAGWHVCLEQLTDLLNGITTGEYPMGDWEKWYEEYKQLLKNHKL